MKNAKTRKTRIAALLMSLVVLVSALVIPTAAAPILDNTDNDYGIRYENGVYTVSINAGALVELLQTENISKQTLMNILPEKLADFLTARDADSAMALLKDLYAAADPAQVKNDIPWDVLTYNISAADLLSILDVDAVLGLIDMDPIRAEVVTLLGNPDVYHAIVTDAFIATVTADGAFLAQVKDLAFVQAMTVEQLSAYAPEGYDPAADPDFPATGTSEEQIDYLISHVINMPALVRDHFDEIPTSMLTRFINAATIAANLETVLAADPAILTAFKNALAAVSPADVLAAVDTTALKAIAGQLLGNLLYVTSVSLNGVNIYNGTFNLAAAEYALLLAMPTPDKLADLPANGGAVASFVLTYSVLDPANPTASAQEYTNGFAIALVGDSADVATIKEYAAKIDDIVHVDFSYSSGAAVGTKLTVQAPAELAKLYVSSLDDEDLPAELREKLFGIGDIVLDDAAIDAAVDAVMNKLTLEELRTLLQSVDLNGYNQKILDLLDMYASQATAVRDRLVDILDALIRQTADNSNWKDSTLADLYQGEGRFHLETSLSIEITLPDTLPAEVTNLFTDLTIQNDFKLDMTFTDLYRVQVLDANGNVVYTAFRTEGDDLSFVFEQDAVSSLGVTEWADVANTKIDTADLQMAAQDMILVPYEEDTTVYTAVFLYNGRMWATRTFTAATASLVTMPVPPVVPYYTTAWDLPYIVCENRTYQVVKTPITYHIDFVDADGNVLAADVPFNVEQFLAGTIQAPAVEEREGYEWVWNYAPLEALYNATADRLDCEISGSYVPAGEAATYTITFYDFDGNAYRTLTFRAGDTALSETPAAPTLPGYHTAWDWDGVLTNANMEVHPKKEIKTYTVTFRADGQVVGTDTYTIEDTEITVPTVPAKTGYTASWAAYTLSFEGDTVVDAVYTAVKYKATFKADGKVVGTVEFTVADSSITAPAVPAKAGYTGQWENYTLGAKDITIEAKYTAVEYTATFKADGKVVGTVKFTVADKSITAPAVPAKAGYTGKWADYTLGAKDITVEAKYTAIEYTATFVDAKGETKVKFTVEGLTAPEVAEKTGYTGKWEDYQVEAKDMTINAVYTVIEYTITFKADGKTVGTAKYTVENTDFTAPDVPEKAGYTGEWKGLGRLTTGDITIEAEYTPIEYTVTFKADGETVGTAKYTVENKNVTAPAVPEKKGYTGAWEAYELTTCDITVNAVYTEIEGGSLLWLWILIGVVVAGGIAVAAVLIIRKKKTAV